MALPKYKKSRSRTHSRRAQWKAEAPQMMEVVSPTGEQYTVPQHLAKAVKLGLFVPKE